MHWVWVLEGKDVNPVLVPKVATQPLNAKVVCHLCEDQCTDSNIIFFSGYISCILTSVNFSVDHEYWKTITTQNTSQEVSL